MGGAFSKDPPAHNLGKYWGELLGVIETIEQGELTRAERLNKQWTYLIKEEKRDPKRIEMLRAQRAVELIKIKNETEKITEKLLETTSPYVAKVLRAGGKTRNVELTRRMIEVIDHPDKELANDIVKGFSVYGEVKDTGLFEKGTQEKMTNKITEREKAKRTQKPNFEDEILKALRAEVQKEVEAGRYEKVKYEQLRNVVSYVFPKDERGKQGGGKVRQITDARPINKLSHTGEK